MGYCGCVGEAVIIQSHSYEVVFSSGAFILLVITCIYFFMVL